MIITLWTTIFKKLKFVLIFLERKSLSLDNPALPDPSRTIVIYIPSTLWVFAVVAVICYEQNKAFFGKRKIYKH